MDNALNYIVRCVIQKRYEIPKPVFLQFELTSIPWGENSSPLVATLQSMVKSILNQNEMSGPSANEHRKLSVEQRIDQMKIQLDDKTKYNELEKYLFSLLDNAPN